MNKFDINYSDNIINDIKEKISNFNWENLPDFSNWDLGVNKEVLRDICNHWITNYSWKKEEKKLNSFNHYSAEVDDLNIHFVYEKGKSPNAIPLLISHGWPGSFLEFNKIIGPLTNPKQYGLDDSICFDLVIPSIPGFVFSSAPKHPYGPRKIASYYDKLMTDVLNYKNYYAQGGDWGGAISTWLGYDHFKNCKGIHLNIMIVRDKGGPQNEEEKYWQKRFKQEQILEEGYRTMQATKPQTLACAMIDNPIGVAAWILEKFYGWSDLREKSLKEVYGYDDLITNIMLYIVTNSFNTASWIYYGRREEGGRIMNFDGGKVNVPTACALFPKELLSWPPRSYVDRLFNVVQWNEYPSGGHFAALEEPDTLVKDIRSFFSKIKN